MKHTFLIITSIAKQEHPILKKFAEETSKHKVSFIVIGDLKSPKEFYLSGCDFYSLKRQLSLPFQLKKYLPFNHYARKNLGYLLAISKGAEIIIETDDDNLPFEDFWNNRTTKKNTHLLIDKGWVNIFRYFTNNLIWPRGFSLENIQDKLPILDDMVLLECPIQQGLADENPDVDAIYRLTLPLPIIFSKSSSIALGNNTFCPFNSQNTTWFKEAFPLLYLPSLCSFRMTDIWRSFVAQRVAWSCGWPILFHQSTVRQVRNNHNLMDDFRNEFSGYINNAQIIKSLKELNLKNGIKNIAVNMKLCYNKLIELGFVVQQEVCILDAWLRDINSFNS